MGLIFFLLTWMVGISLTRRCLDIKGIYLWSFGWGVGVVGTTWLSFGLAWLSAYLGSSTPVSTSIYPTLVILIGLAFALGKPSASDLKLSPRQLYWALGVLLISAGLMFSTFNLDSANHELVMDRLVFSDFANHIPLIRSFSLGENVPPESPLFAGAPIRYHFMFYFFVGMLEHLGMAIDWALNLTSTLGFATFLVGIPFLTRAIFPQANLAWTGLGATALTLCAGPLLPFLKFPFAIWSPLALWRTTLGRTEFLSGGPYYNWDQTITGLFWTLTIFTNQRHFGLGLGMGLFLFALVLKSKALSTRSAIFLGALWGLFPLFHGLSFLAFMILLGCLWIFRTPRRPLFFLLSIATVIAIPQMLSLSPSNPEAAPSFYLGYAIHRDFGFLRFFNYWIQNIGLKLLLIPIFIFWWKGRARLVLGLCTLIFILPNVVKFGPDIYTNHKFFNLWLVFINIFTAQWLYEVWKQAWWRRASVVVIAFTLTFSGFMDIFPVFNDTTIKILDWPADPIAKYIKENTSPHDVFATSYGIYHPAQLAGRKVLLGWPYFLWSSGYLDRERKLQVKQILETPNSFARCQALKRLGARYLLVGNDPRYSEPYTPKLDQLLEEMPMRKKDARYILLDSHPRCQNMPN